MEKVILLVVLLVFLTSCSAYAQEMSLPVRIFNGDELLWMSYGENTETY